jgi:transcriptional regulator with XRE-family HTH domain
VPQPSISRIERGVVSPSADTLDALVRACGMDLEIVEHPGRGVDRTLVRERLKMSPAERLRYTVEATQAVDRLVASRRTAS